MTGDITLGDLILLNHRAKINRQVKIKTLFKEHFVAACNVGYNLLSSGTA